MVDDEKPKLTDYMVEKVNRSANLRLGIIDEPDVEGLSPAETLAKQAEEPPTPSAIPFVQRTPRQFYGHTNAQHGVHPEPAPGPVYENAEVKDLYERLRRKFKEIGYEF